MNAETPADASALRSAMVTALISNHGLADPRWISAFAQVPREHFVPRFLIPSPEGPREVRRDQDQSAWLRLVYTDEPLTISFNGPYSTSSSSQPSLMGAMLQSLRCTGIERVLEVGTGTGYNTALLCHGLSDHQVTTIDIDPDLVRAARVRLASLGYYPALVSGDGETGCPQAAPFDRIIATCAVTRVPDAWRDQTRPGGIILVNLYRELGGGALALLTVDPSGQASGHFEPYPAGFMPSRNLSRTPAANLIPDHDRTARVPARGTALPAEILRDDSFGMLAALRTDAQQVTLLPDNSPEEFWLVSRNGSWACQTTGIDGNPLVRQDGPVRIWDQIESAHATWTALGRPLRHTFGLTVTTTGQHITWHDHPANQLWHLDDSLAGDPSLA
jgi:methyltransferase of ATP-grasp peptide maturase system